jgi:hypothetical protein
MFFSFFSINSATNPNLSNKIMPRSKNKVPHTQKRVPHKENKVTRTQKRVPHRENREKHA